MNILTTRDQGECAVVLAALNAVGKVVPQAPNRACTGMVKLGGGNWVVIENDSGQYTIHALEGATKDEAWKFFDGTFRSNRLNPRVEYVGPS